MFGQLIIGPPGSGKTTYCFAMHEFIEQVNTAIWEKINTENDKYKKKKVAIINLDPANECVSYEPDVDVRFIYSMQSIMQDKKLGPNGAILKSIELLDKNFDWLAHHINALIASNEYDYNYFLFDCPGQIELYTTNLSFINFLKKLSTLNINLVVANLVDSVICQATTNYIAATLVSLISMLNLALPQVNIFSKVGLLDVSKLHFDLSYYCEVLDLKYMSQVTENTMDIKYQRLHETICSVIEDYSLVSYFPCYLKDKKNMAKLLQLLDKAIGYNRSSINSYKNSEGGRASDIIREEKEIDPMFPILFDEKLSKFINELNFFDLNKAESNIKSTTKYTPEDLLEIVIKENENLES